MEIEPKNQSRNFRSEKFVCSDFLAEWKTALKNFSCRNDVRVRRMNRRILKDNILSCILS